jgi:hypothetical protein
LLLLQQKKHNQKKGELCEYINMLYYSTVQYRNGQTFQKGGKEQRENNVNGLYDVDI